MSGVSKAAEWRSTEAQCLLPEELREELTEMGPCELGFEGCIEVHQVEKYNPGKGNTVLMGLEVRGKFLLKQAGAVRGEALRLLFAMLREPVAKCLS